MPYLLISLSFVSIFLNYIEQSNFTFAIISLLVIIATFQNASRFVLSYLLLSLFFLYSILHNDLIDAIRSATPIATLLPIFLTLWPYLKSNRHLKCNKGVLDLITLLYIIGVVQVLVYLIQVSQSGYYYYLKSLSEQYRINVGWLAIVSFFAAFISIGESYVGNLTPVGNSLRIILVTIVPLIVFLNSSRSEKLVVSLFIGMSLIRMTRTSKNVGLSIFYLVVLVSFSIGLIYYNLNEDILRSSEELVFSDVTDVSMIHEKFRAYETRLLIEKLLENRWYWLFGYGFGVGVDMDTGVSINGRIYSSLAVFHNGFLGYILQTGLIGLFILINIFIETVRSVLRVLFSKKSDLSMFLVLYSGSNIILILTSATTGGFASSSDVQMLVTVYAICILIARRVVNFK